MQFSKQWLSTYLDGDLNQINLSDILTSAGLEVEDVQDLSVLSNLVVVGEITKLVKHPDADRLNICTVNIGEVNPLQIVCGAPNVRVGMKVPCAKVGAKLSAFEIKKAKLRGVESLGMLCSAKEIGLTQDSDGLLELDASAKVGTKVIDSLSLDDSIYTLSLTPNRADCLSMMGIAREVAALTSMTLKLPDSNKLNNLDTLNQEVIVKDKVACPRYCGRQIKGINNQVKIPNQIKNYLERAGIGSINPVVDITNFVLLEFGQPLHAFDQKKIYGSIQIRQAVKGEKLILLDEQEINFVGGELVIADSKKPLALAGIMGGLESAINENTNEVFLEGAYFDPVSISGRARSFGLNTNSSHRFERGVDYLNIINALDRATQLIIEICGGSASEIIDLSYNLPTRPTISLRTEKVSSIMGTIISKDKIEQTLIKLLLPYEKEKNIFKVTPPSYRFDLKIEEDLIEEVIRMYGYDNIPAITPMALSTMLSHPAQLRTKNDIKSSFANLGYNEIVSYSFIDKETEENFHANKNVIELKNPIASQMNVMRSKIWGSHIEALIYNLNRSQTQVRLFEIAATYLKIKEEFLEQEVLSGLVYGTKNPEQWGKKEEEINFYDIKGDIESFSSNTLRFITPKSKVPGAFHPGQVAQILMKNESQGWLGQLHPIWQQKYNLPGKVYLFELSLKALMNNTKINFKMPSKFLSIRRDIAVIVDHSIAVGEIINEVKKAGIDKLDEFYPFDIYEGNGIEKGKKSIAFLILMQDTCKTLEDKEVANVVNQVLSVLQDKFKAQLR